LSEGCVAGVMRRHLVDTLPSQGYTVLEKEVVPDELVEADEIFLTNAVSGVKWVSDFRNRKFGNALSAKIFQSTIQ
jgi:branched-chain amino acid aminotransferase